MLKMETLVGDHISRSCAEAAKAALECSEAVSFEFNGVAVIAEPGETAEILEARWQGQMDEKARAYRESPEGKAALAEQAIRQAAYRIASEKALAEGILPFSCTDPASWQSWVDANQDPYGACVVRYAARWANLMEKELSAGASLPDIADRLSHEADTEGITGFMYGAAVAMLAECWEHGETLRRWHNKAMQIGDEGDRANETGGVLNPALLGVG